MVSYTVIVVPVMHTILFKSFCLTFEFYFFKGETATKQV